VKETQTSRHRHDSVLQPGLSSTLIIAAGRHHVQSHEDAIIAEHRGSETFRRELRDLGWVEGQNLVIEDRFAEGREARVSDIAHEFVTGQVEVVVVPNAGTAERVQRVTRTVPIVVLASGDLVTAGLVASLARPGGNVTGLQILQPDLVGKRLEFLQGAVPQVSRVGFLFLGPRDRPVPAATLRETETAARALGVELHVLELQGSPDEFHQAFAALRVRQGRAVMVHAHPFMGLHRATIAALAREHRLPTIFESRRYVEAGGLMSYGPNGSARERPRPRARRPAREAATVALW
jgi:ABC-type uncharacterized transport system substrate-binding protein